MIQESDVCYTTSMYVTQSWCIPDEIDLCHFRICIITHNNNLFNKTSMYSRSKFCPQKTPVVIDQVWGQDGWILAKFSCCIFMDGAKLRYINSQKKERGQYLTILTEQIIKDLLHGFREIFSCGIQRVVPSGQDLSILPVWVAKHIARFGSSCPLAELAI